MGGYVQSNQRQGTYDAPLLQKSMALASPNGNQSFAKEQPASPVPVRF